MSSARQVQRLLGGLAAALLAMAALPAGAGASTTVDTAAGWDGSQHIWPFGSAAAGNTPTYGETVTVPSGDNRLDGFSFRLDVPTDVVFRGEVYRWDDATGAVTGPELWSGGPTATGAYDPSGTTYQDIGFDTGGLALSPGEHVVLFVTTLRDADSDAAYGFAAARWGAGDAYPGGMFVYSNDGTLADLLADPWSSFDGGFTAHVDAVFHASFSSAYTLSGFPGAATAARAGQTVPVTWTLLAAGGAPVIEPAGMSLASAPCDGGAATPVATAGASGWQSDGAGGWQVNWKTQKAWAGTCRALTLTLPDGNTRSTVFSFR